MRFILCWCLIAVAPLTAAQTSSIPPNTGVCLNAEEAALVQLVNNFRVQNGKAALPVTRWLSTTAQWHVWDRINNPSAVGGVCNTHSWSNNPPHGVTWTGMCYTSDHAQAAQMWAKPRQISANAYGGNGYENAADSGIPMTAAQALAQWQSSPGHLNVILNQGAWAGVTFRGIGVGILGNYAVLWFGDAVDPGGPMSTCQTEVLFTGGFE
jgi:uncharacterized protein YkwD